MPNAKCKECQELWRSYSIATADHIGLTGKLRIATLEHDRERMATLTLAVEAAANLRYAGRGAIRQHELEPHPSPDGVMDATPSDCRGADLPVAPGVPPRP